MSPTNEDAIQALTDSLSQVLEEAAFMFLEPVEEGDEPPPFEEEPLTSAMGFSGSAQGRIYLSTDRGTCMGLASELMGVDEDELSPTDGEASLGELLNIVAGVLMEALYGAEALISLQPPETATGQGKQGQVKISMLTDMGQRFDLSLEV